MTVYVIAPPEVALAAPQAGSQPFYQAELANRDAVIAWYKQELQRKDDWIASCNQELQNKDAVIARQRQDIQNLNSSIAHYQQEIQKRNAQIEDLAIEACTLSETYGPAPIAGRDDLRYGPVPTVAFLDREAER